ncbi:MAG: hypothetical protein ABL911_10675 [Gallionella sp.]|nr:hypothetical protein [Gallionella sp.]
MQYLSAVTSLYETAGSNSPLRGSFGLTYLQVWSLVAHPDKECGGGLIIQLQFPSQKGGRN